MCTSPEEGKKSEEINNLATRVFVEDVCNDCKAVDYNYINIV